MALSGPVIAEELKDAEESYPWPWIAEAFKIAIHENKRSWRYIAAILRRQAAEGRTGAMLPGRNEEHHGEPGRYTRRIAAGNSLKTTNGDRAGGDRAGLRSVEGFEPEEPAGPNCPLCDGAGWVSKRVPVGHPDFGEAFPCRCQQERNPTNRSEALPRYQQFGPTPPHYPGRHPPGRPLPDDMGRRMFQDALTATVDFAANPSGWLVFTGPAVAARRTWRWRRPTVALTWVAPPTLSWPPTADHLRAAFAPDNLITYDELFEQVRNVPVLVLDDLTYRATTPWAQEKLLQIFNHRFNAQLPTIITVRGPLERLDEGLRTRMESFGDFSKVFRLGEHNSRLTRRIGDIPGDMQQRMTLEAFDVQGGYNTSDVGQSTLIRARQAAETFAAHPQGWLLFTGPRGCGKTHLAIAIAGESLRQGRTVFYAFVPSLLDHLRATFSPDSPIGYDELFEQVKTTPLLILDDLGTETTTPWAEEKLYQIVVYRYDVRLPTVITSVFSVEELEAIKPRIGSRLVDGMMVDWHPISALQLPGPTAHHLKYRIGAPGR